MRPPSRAHAVAAALALIGLPLAALRAQPRPDSTAGPPCVLIPLDTLGFGRTPAQARVCLQPGVGARAVQLIGARASDTLWTWWTHPTGLQIRTRALPRPEVPIDRQQRTGPTAWGPVTGPAAPLAAQIRVAQAAPTPTTRAWTSEATTPWRLDSLRVGAQRWAAPTAADPCRARGPVQWQQPTPPVLGKVCVDASGGAEIDLVVREPLTPPPPGTVPACGQLGVCLQLTLDQGPTVWPQWRAAFDLARRQPRWLKQAGRGGPWVLDSAGPAARSVLTFTGQMLDSLPGWRLLVRSVGPWRVRAIGMSGRGVGRPEQWTVPSPPKAAGSPSQPPGRSDEEGVTILGSAAQRLGGTGDRWGRAIWGLEATGRLGATHAQATLFPTPVVQPLLPLMADPNRRLPRLMPEGRPELRELQDSPGSYLWMDTWRIDQTGAVVTLRDTADRWRSVAALDASGRLSVAALRIGAPRLRLRGGVMRTRDGLTVREQQQPWASVFTLEGALGTSWEPDTSHGETSRDTAQILLRPVPRGPRARAAWTHSGRLGLLGDGRSTLRLEAEQPMGRQVSLGLQQEWLPAGLSESGAIRAPWEGLWLNELVLRQPPPPKGVGGWGWDLRFQHVEPWRGPHPWRYESAPGGEQHLLAGTTWRRREQRVRLQVGADHFRWPGLATPWRPQLVVDGEHALGGGLGSVWRLRLDRQPLFLPLLAEGRTAALRGGLRWTQDRPRRLLQTLVLVEGGRSTGCGPSGGSALRWTGSEWVARGPLDPTAAVHGCDLLASTLGLQTVVRWLTPRLQLQLEGVLVGDRPLEARTTTDPLAPSAVVSLQGPQVRGLLAWRTPWGTWRVEGSCWQPSLGLARGCGSATSLRVPLAARRGTT